MGTRLLWPALALAVALPRWLYLAASFTDEGSSLRTLAWAVDVACLVTGAVSLWRLQHRIGSEASLSAMRIALTGFALDAATTLVSPWVKTPVVLIVAGVAGWTWGTSTWLSHRCQESGAPYFVYRVFLVCVALSALLAFLRPDGPVFPSSLIIDTCLAVQCILVVRASRSNVAAP